MDAQTLSVVVQTVAVVLSAGGVAYTVFANATVAKRRATLDILLQEQASEHLIKERTEFTKVRDAGHLAQWLQPANAGKPEAAIVRATLNRYELVALGIRRDIVDGGVYKTWFRSTLVRDWIALKPLIVELRNAENRVTYFAEFEAVARMWAEKSERTRV